jgi:hypothetical protein
MSDILQRKLAELDSESRFVGLYPYKPTATLDLKKDFVTEYVFWASKMTDAPLDHQLLASLAGIATAIGPVKLSWKQSCLPNVQIDLLGRTYTERKSQGTLRCFKEVIPENLVLQATEFSPQSIQSLIQEHEGQGLLILDEYGMFLRDCRKRDYMSGMPRLMMKWYDAAPMLKETYSNPVHIDNPYINVLCLSTRETVVENIDKYDISAGLVGRQIHWYAERKKGQYLDPTTIAHEDEEKAKQLRQGLQDLYQHRIEKAVFELEAEKILKAYKRQMDDECQDRNDNVYSAVAGRYGGDYSTKFAMLFQFSQEDPRKLPDPIVIGKVAVERAIGLTKRCIDNAMQEVVFYVTANAAEKVYRMIENLSKPNENDGWVRRRDVMNKSKLSADEFSKVIATLEAQEDILVGEINPTVKGGRPGEKYKPVRATRERIRSMMEEGSA